MTVLEVTECDDCGDRFDPEIRLTDLELIYPAGPYDSPSIDTVHACSDCGPPALRDTRESVPKVKITADGEVTELYFYSHDWVPFSEVEENPYVVDAVDYIESALVDVPDDVPE